MQKNDVIQNEEGSILRILKIEKEMILVINCINQEMPFWMSTDEMQGYKKIEQFEREYEISERQKADAQRRYTMISEILSVISSENKRITEIRRASEEYGISKQTIRRYLWIYLVAQDIRALAPASNRREKILSAQEKNMRWALNKYYYTSMKHSLRTAYTLLLKSKYCDMEGNLESRYPSFYQFRYFYRKTKKIQNEIISREGIKAYQKDNRPLIGGSVQAYAPAPGVGMFDATVCDIYLVDDERRIVGRPILTACVDAYSGLCCGYCLTWEGGVYSLRNLMLNIVEDKVCHCKRFGISITSDMWPSHQMPARFITDKGSEYCSDTFSQLAELGVILTNLPAYRPDLKGPIEKFFDTIQGYFKSYLKRKGVIEPDYQQRGARDYRLDACLTMYEFEQIILYCIVYYNSKRILENFQYDKTMLETEIRPYSNEIWKWGLKLEGCNLIEVDKVKLMKTLLPRTTGRFTRYGLKVNRIRYYNPDYTEQYLKGGTVIVTYNPDDVSNVYVIQDDRYVEFALIENRYKDMSLLQVDEMIRKQRKLIQNEAEEKLQAQIELASHIQTIAELARAEKSPKGIKQIRQNRKNARLNSHKDLEKEARRDGYRNS